ncbi:stalk domain-containing protein [Paenibacillus agricola]|uniref:Copper amine oxidase-like N-terminal domain-containing protein n=1 Tax=Paenibacillus agricola TaxID=2716264 RepID=A0ABX0J2C6_9BACL|nr:stalk domain-containing protein [Paenibacillus agricola]NHN30502.1 hypothetical protein [Paenibacillus agricola]
MKKMILGLVIGMMIGSIATASAASLSEVTAVFANFIFKVNGQVKQLDRDTTPLVYNGSSYLPVRGMANLVGFDVDYNTESRTIELKERPFIPIPKVEPVDLTKWVSLLDLSYAGIKTTVSPGTSQIKIEYGTQNFVFELPNNTNIEKTSISSPGEIKLLISDGTTYLNIMDLQRLKLPFSNPTPATPVLK